MYTQQFNRLHSRVGHVFQGRFKGILVEKENYLLELSRYIVLNPVRANMVATAPVGYGAVIELLYFARPQFAVFVLFFLGQRGL
jgi:hypothetical protein